MFWSGLTVLETVHVEGKYENLHANKYGFIGG